MILQQRIDLLVRLGEYMQANGEEWVAIKDRAARSNAWFVPEFIEQAALSITEEFLQKDKLENWVAEYKIPVENLKPKIVGLVMAGNLPMVGFHDMLCIFITGHQQVIKLSSKDDVLIKHLVNKLIQWNAATAGFISFADKLNGCEVYIATGSNNSSRYFEYYFGKFPNIIRRNRTSVAILEGNETAADLDNLADDMQMYFGLGCRNVTKLYVPAEYNFEPLLLALNKYAHFGDYHKYRHNYDYQLALLMMGSKFYMTNSTILFSENQSLFTAVSQIHYEVYVNKNELLNELKSNNDVQCIVANGEIRFGKAQYPALTDYADGIDTMKFLISL